MRVTRVLVAVDPPAPAGGPFGHALALTHRLGAELVTVANEPPGHTTDALAERLLERTLTAEPDLVVVSAGERRGLRRATPAGRLVEQSAVPVLVVPPRGAAGLHRTSRHVAVAVDFTASARHVLAHAAAWAGGSEGRVTLLHVMPHLATAADDGPVQLGIVTHQQLLMRDDHEKARRAALARLRLAMVEAGHPAVGRDAEVLSGDPATALARAAERIGADLLIVGVPRRGALFRALFASTAARVAGTTRVPVLAVPDGSPPAGKRRQPLGRAA